jgi:fluoride ion exporter CrcB/FEX
MHSTKSVQVLNGFMLGYCGCLTTISTFILELSKMTRSEAWKYFVLSFISSHILLLLIVGIYQIA